MTDMLAIAIADRPRGGQDAAGMHRDMLKLLAREAGRAGWGGVTFTDYRHERATGATLIQAEPGEDRADLDALKAFTTRRKQG